MTREYGRALAERLLALVDDTSAIEFRDDSVCMKQEWVDVARMGADWLNWTPQCALQQPARQVCELLPIPFSGRQLAAFMLCPVADRLTDIFGEHGRLDTQELVERFDGVQDGECKTAIADAYSHLARATAKVGAKDTDTLWLESQSTAQEYERKREIARICLGISPVHAHGLSDVVYTQRIDEVNAGVAELKASMTQARKRAAEAEINWLRRMTLAVFESESIQEESALAAPAALRPISRARAQDAAIIEAIRHLGHDPIALPANPPGKPGVKAEVKKVLKGNSLFTGRTVFEKTWDRLRSACDIGEAKPMS